MRVAGLDGLVKVPNVLPYYVVARRERLYWRYWLSNRVYSALVLDLGGGFPDPDRIWNDGLKEALMSYIRKKVDRKVEREDSGKPIDEYFAVEWPAVYEYLTTTSLEGKARQTSTLSIFVRGDRFVAILNDREEGYSLWAEAEEFGRLLPSLEASLRLPDPPWRKNLDHDPKRSRKRS